MIQKKDIIEGLEEVWAAWENFGSELSEEEWLTSSRCPGWTVKDNLSHIAGTENMLAGNPTGCSVLHKSYIIYIRNLRTANTLINPSNNIAQNTLSIIF